MTKRVHRGLTAALSGLTALSALLAATDPSTLEVSGTTWAWVAMGLAVATIVVTAARQAFESEGGA